MKVHFALITHKQDTFDTPRWTSITAVRGRHKICVSCTTWCGVVTCATKSMSLMHDNLDNVMKLLLLLL